MKLDCPRFERRMSAAAAMMRLAEKRDTRDRLAIVVP
jgi:hypothetical protein